MADGARIVGVKTARAGALVSKLIVSGTYHGGKQVVTWTGAHTREGTAITLDLLGLIERPVPPDVLERLPDDLLFSLTALEFVKPRYETEKIVISSPDSRWEGEIFYCLRQGGTLEVVLEGPVELIVVTLASFAPLEKGRKPESRTSFYSLFVREDDSALGEVAFEAEPLDLLSLYGYSLWRVSEPGVFVIKVIEGVHRYSLTCKREDSDDFVLISFYLPRYEFEETLDNLNSGNRIFAACLP